MAIPCKSVDQLGWLKLREQLWPHHPSAEHLAEMASFLASPERFAQFIEYDHSGNALGFAEAFPPQRLRQRNQPHRP
jgi:aminoglycoside 6'-N-acetyltransferase I